MSREGMSIVSKLSRAFRGSPRHRRLYEKYKDRTMVPFESFAHNLELCERFGDVEGAVAECGVWKGGMSAAMAEVLGAERTYYLFDS